MTLGTERISIPSLGVVVNRFPSLMPKLTDIDSQWCKPPYAFSDSKKIDMSKITTDLMWGKNTRNEKSYRRKSFPDLAELAERVHSNADSERNFSWISDVKTKKRNRLKKKSIEAVLVTWIATKNKIDSLLRICPYRQLDQDPQFREPLRSHPTPWSRSQIRKRRWKRSLKMNRIFSSFFNVAEVKFWWWCKTLCFSNAANRFEKKDELRNKTKIMNQIVNQDPSPGHKKKPFYLFSMLFYLFLCLFCLYPAFVPLAG